MNLTSWQKKNLNKELMAEPLIVKGSAFLSKKPSEMKGSSSNRVGEDKFE